MSMVDTAPGKIQVRDLNFYYGKFHVHAQVSVGVEVEVEVDAGVDADL